MNCSECNKRMKRYLWGFTYFYICEDCGDIILTSEVEEQNE